MALGSRLFEQLAGLVEIQTARPAIKIHQPESERCAGMSLICRGGIPLDRLPNVPLYAKALRIQGSQKCLTAGITLLGEQVCLDKRSGPTLFLVSLQSILIAGAG